MIEIQNPLRQSNEIIGIKPPSLLKWTGSKRSQAAIIKGLGPHKINRYFEPFLGGGSVLYFFTENNCLVSDVYSPLIQFWTLVKENPSKVINYYTKNWQLLQEDFPGYYYVVRDNFNSKPNGLDLSFLSRTCVNGIIRFNGEGKFNNSIHLSRRGMVPDKFEEIVNGWHSKLEKVEFMACSFEESLSRCKKGDFVYMDPPYEGTKQRYISSIDFQLLWNILDKLNSKGVNWALSFDGSRGEKEYSVSIPKEIYITKHDINCGLSALSKVLNAKSEIVTESLYCNY